MAGLIVVIELIRKEPLPKKRRIQLIAAMYVFAVVAISVYYAATVDYTNRSWHTKTVWATPVRTDITF